MAPILGVRTCPKCAHSFHEGPQLHCRYNPPTVQAIVMNGPQGPFVAGNATLFPCVTEAMTCSQWKARVELASSSDVAALG